MDIDQQLRHRLETHYCKHKDFMSEGEFEQFIESNFISEFEQQPWINTLGLLFPALSSLKILEIGRGTGGFVVALRKSGLHVDGCDLSEDNVEMSILRGEKHDLTEDAFSLCGKATLPYSDAAYDLVVMFDVLEHVTDIESVLAEVSLVLRGGSFFSSSPNGLCPKEPHVKLLFPHWLPTTIRNSYVKANARGACCNYFARCKIFHPDSVKKNDRASLFYLSLKR